MENMKLPKGWVETTVKEVNLRKSENLTPGKTPDETFELYSVPIFPKKEPESLLGEEIKSSKQVVYGDEVLLCKINPRINRVWIVGNFTENRKIASSEWIIVDTKKSIPSDYLKYTFSAPFFRSLMQSEVSGVGGSLTRARPKLVNDYKIPLPPLPEQKRLVKKLDGLFGHLEVLQERLARVPDLLKDFRQSVLTQAVTGKLTEEWREGRELDEWKDSKLKENITLISGFAFKSRDYCEKGISLTKISNIGYSCYIEKDTKFLPIVFIDEYPKFVIQKNDLLIALTRPITNGMVKVCRYKKSKPSLLNQRVAKLIPNNKIRPEYLLYFLQSNETKEKIKGLFNETLQPNLSPKDLQNLNLKLPTLDEQTQIVTRVQSLFQKADRIEARYESLRAKIETLPQAILAKAFRGELTEQLDTDGDARELLAEIAALRAEGKRKKKGSGKEL